MKAREFKEKLEKVFSDRRNWDRRIEIDGKTFVYKAARNEVRQVNPNNNRDISNTVAFFYTALGKRKIVMFDVDII